MAHTKINAYKEDEIQIAKIAKAFGHPARLAILRHLIETNECCCSEIVKSLPIAQATVSQHLKILKEAGLIEGAISPPKVCYCINWQYWAKSKSLLEKFMTLSH